MIAHKLGYTAFDTLEKEQCFGHPYVQYREAISYHKNSSEYHHIACAYCRISQTLRLIFDLVVLFYMDSLNKTIEVFFYIKAHKALHGTFYSVYSV